MLLATYTYLDADWFTLLQSKNTFTYPMWLLKSKTKIWMNFIKDRLMNIFNSKPIVTNDYCNKSLLNQNVHSSFNEVAKLNHSWLIDLK